MEKYINVVGLDAFQFTLTDSFNRESVPAYFNLTVNSSLQTYSTTPDRLTQIVSENLLTDIKVS